MKMQRLATITAAFLLGAGVAACNPDSLTRQNTDPNNPTDAPPGPVFTTATFVGYLVGGFPGAIVATIGIFLPAFVFVSASGWLIPRIRKSPLAAAMLDGINAGSLALMGVVTWQLVTTAVVDIPTALLAIAAIIGLFVLRLNSVWLITGAALAGLAAAAL